MFKKQIVAGVLGVILLLCTGLFLHRPGKKNETVDNAPLVQTSAVHKISAPPITTGRADPKQIAAQAAAPAAQESLAPPEDPAEFEKWAAGSLRAKKGALIHDKGQQAALIQLRKYLQDKYPQEWAPKLERILRDAFPEFAGQILDTFQRMDHYNEWLEQSKPDLATLPEEEIKQLLWQKRRSLFGEDAAQIWTVDSEIEEMRDTIDILKEAYHIPLEDKLHVFANAIKETDQDSTDFMIQNKKYALAAAFLNMDSVQVELAQMNPAERSEVLRRIRKSMGIDDQEVERLDKIDAQRDLQWQTGMAYMTEREQLTRQYQGAELEEQLQTLRQKHFMDQAATIAAEESADFFRFKRRRVYGRN